MLCIDGAGRGRIEAGSTEPYLPGVSVTAVTVAHPYALQDAYTAQGVLLPFTFRRQVRSAFSGWGSRALFL